MTQQMLDLYADAQRTIVEKTVDQTRSGQTLARQSGLDPRTEGIVMGLESQENFRSRLGWNLMHFGAIPSWVKRVDNCCD